MEDVRLYAQRHVEIMLVGNKVDLPEDRVVDYKDAKAYAEKHSFQYFETSAKTKINVDKAFTKLTQTVYATKSGAASDAPQHPANNSAHDRDLSNTLQQTSRDRRVIDASGGAASAHMCACLLALSCRLLRLAALQKSASDSSSSSGSSQRHVSLTASNAAGGGADEIACAC